MSTAATITVSSLRARAGEAVPRRGPHPAYPLRRLLTSVRRFWIRILGGGDVQVTSSEVADAGMCAGAATFSVAMTSDSDDALAAHLLRTDGQEDLIFALYQPSTGMTRTTAILVDLVYPQDGERHLHGNASFLGDYFLRAAGLAAERDLGLAFLHSHPGCKGWQGMSRDDYAAESGHAGATQLITGLPLVGLTLAGHDRTYSARRWYRPFSGSERPAAAAQTAWVDEQATTVRVVGEQIKASYNDSLVPVPAPTRRSQRTVQSWGKRAHDDLIRLRIGVIGGGSVAQLVAESLVRTGFIHVDIFDFDLVEEHNLDRLLHATEADIGKSKVGVLVDLLRTHTVTPDAVVHGFDDSVIEQQGWLRALDCDVLFSCVDRPWPRFALNVAAYAHLIPVVDGGVAVDVRAGDQGMATAAAPFRLIGAEWRAHLVGPNRECMECLGQYDPGEVGMERAGLLDDPTYIASLPAHHHLRRGENVFVFSMACAAAEVLELLRAVLGPSKIHDVGATLTHWTTATTERDVDGCRAGCPFPTQLQGRGDAAGVDVTGRHRAAAAARAAARPIESMDVYGACDGKSSTH
ncbi:ThiF family adenylyltransferase [Mycobacterium malmoense]|uniref:ThiF family adenylyltransferase n=1 Tax=Mycobacterium malmoense TaxID=1780 RepID=UPI0008F8BBA1|nr:ThiF family adenylyltransferase [Mycobacterium malmoense]OIN78904.1 hypothetical protein BMG05_20670 [Mycobacterium malmoense]QZA18770.1 ThiF family adenylyltransferase [Mycobacterium malmoense]UNB95540.1 ThiF family adenylyltransferase [Mycobacterium malmoense]